uniref:Uncharacterized protein n=1 Tax=Arundo donax TaxID=35708 RepID=A0A0A9BVF5_ARUDO
MSYSITVQGVVDAAGVFTDVCRRARQVPAVCTARCGRPAPRPVDRRRCRLPPHGLAAGALHAPEHDVGVASFQREHGRLVRSGTERLPAAQGALGLLAQAYLGEAAGPPSCGRCLLRAP